MKRTVQKITPQRASSFDQRVWPVIVALTVLCGISVGAILTLFNGPWMWGSLLILPVFSALALFLLFYLDDSFLRRSLQLAIILSLAIHMLILVVTSVVHIFQNPFQQPEKKVAQRQERTIEISDQHTQFVWEETNPRETPEPKIEAQRQQLTTTDVQPQPIPVETRQQEPKPQLQRRETPKRTVPRQDQQLSQLRRQTRNAQPKSSQQTIAKPAIANAKSVPEPSSSSKAEAIKKQTAANPTATDVSAEKAKTKPSEAKREIAAAASSPRRANPAPEDSDSAPQSSTSSARVRKVVPKLPLVQKKATVPDVQSASANTRAQPQPSPATAEITRRPTTSQIDRPSQLIQPQTERSPASQLARGTQRRPSNNIAPSISSPTSSVQQPRRSARDASVAVSPVAIEKPSRQPDSQTASTELNSKTLSVSRSSAGVAGAGRSQNLAQAIGGMPSPAVRASDSAVRRRTESRPTETRMLTISQSSSARRSAGAANNPSSAFKADTTAAAKIAGSQTPTDRSVESSAARIDSRSADQRGEISAEKGHTTVDLGPTKVVRDIESPRRSGGGQPEVAQFNPETTRRSRNTSQQPSTLVADTGVEAIAPSSRTSSPPTAEIKPSNVATAVARKGGSAPVSSERDAAIQPGDFSNRGQSAASESIADATPRAARRGNTSLDFSEDEDKEESKQGNQRTRVAQAPVTRGNPGFGNSKSSNQSSIAQSEQPVDTPSESVATTLQRQATSALPGSGIGRSATTLLMQAATSLPVIDPATAGSAKRKSTSNESSSKNELSRRLTSSSSARSNSKAKPALANGATEALPAAQFSANSRSNYELDSTSIALERTALTAAEQGASLEIIAVEGPAGLADRPSEYLGVMTRPASRDSEQIQPELDTRFRNSRFGGTPAVNPDAVLAREAFRQRTPAAILNSAEPTTEAAIHLGLEFLTRYQSPDGSWSLAGFDQEHPQHVSQLNSDTAGTGLALLAFQGAGYNHREFRYARQVKHGLKWLIENQQPNGCLYVPMDEKSNSSCRLYSHGIAALALTEAYGMTQDLQIKSAAQRALDYIAESQDSRKGGWRYFDTPNLRSTDTSVTGWMMMALQSGRLAGLDVDQKTFDGIEQWLDSAAAPDDESQYRYSPFVVDSEGRSRQQGRKASPSMTSVGLLMRIYTGWDRNDPRLLDGATYLMQQQLPSDATPRQRDTYYWYYATQVLKYIDGPLWNKWDSQLRPLLIRSQIKTGDLAGSWHPYNPVPDRWGSFGGRLYVTTMNLLSLEVRHRMLPLYQKTNEADDVSKD
jgi:hypothetical protein